MNPRSFYNSDAAVEHYLGIRWAPQIWAAVLEQAVNDVLHGPPEWETREMNASQLWAYSTEIRNAAQCWIDDESNEPRRFVWVCEQLDLSPSAVRRSIRIRLRKGE